MRTAVVAVSLVATAVQAQGFRVWIDAPETVVSGQSYTADVWAEAIGFSSADPEDQAFIGFVMDVLFEEIVDGVSVSPAYDPLFGSRPHIFEPGNTDETGLLGVQGLQLFPMFFGAPHDNPARLFSFDVSTAVRSTGDITLIPAAGFPNRLTFVLDVNNIELIFSDNPALTLTIESATTSIIPVPASASASVVVLGLAASARRRRR